MRSEQELQESVNEILRRFSRDLREQSATLATKLDQMPEVRTYLKAVGVENIRDLTPKQMREMTMVIFSVMNRRVHPGAN